MRTKKLTTVYLEQEHLDKLKKRSEETMIPVAAMIRTAIDEYLKENK